MPAVQVATVRNVPPLELLTEKQWQRTVVECAALCGWLAYHTFDSRRSTAGFPDLILVRGARCIAAELKREGKAPTADQAAWLSRLGQVPGIEAYCWTPSQWPAVQEALR